MKKIHHDPLEWDTPRNIGADFTKFFAKSAIVSCGQVFDAFFRRQTCFSHFREVSKKTCDSLFHTVLNLGQSYVHYGCWRNSNKQGNRQGNGQINTPSLQGAEKRKMDYSHEVCEQ